ncbi:MAG TPA: DAK2 domain-containing protein [Mycobacteriales bacterium]|nr:DAK2 domain-containing protein [Mycobacteriales bacterium]
MRPGQQEPVPARLDPAAVRRWCAAGLASLRAHRREIDDLNVYPVPDGDTGTNLVETFAAACAAVDAGRDTASCPDAELTPLGAVLRRLARGALLGARGNSGVILAQLLGGIAAELADVHEAGGRELTVALRTAAAAAYDAVAEPVEGTVLTVARAAADAAWELGSDDLADVCTVAARSAAQALARTPEQLPALARAGVVDAGGRGLVVLLDALAGVATGSTPTLPLAPAPAPLVADRETGSDAYSYEVQYLLAAPDAALGPLRVELGALGDSLVVVGDGDGMWNVHVHVDDVGAAIEAGIRAGRPSRIGVTRFADQIPARASADGVARPAPAAVARGVVVVVEGTGIAELFAAEGATVVDGGPAANPSTAEVLTAIRATGAGAVVVLPNDANCQAVASAAAAEARREGVQVAVVPTRSPMQAVAALAVRDPDRRFDDDVIAMAEAAGATRCAELAVAARDALTSAGRCSAGDVLALVEGEVVLVAPGPAETALAAAAAELLDRMLSSGGELVTLVLGDSAPAGLGETVRRHVARTWPLVEVQSFFGGQPHHPLLVGVE